MIDNGDGTLSFEPGELRDLLIIMDAPKVRPDAFYVETRPPIDITELAKSPIGLTAPKDIAT